jgi:hypothetical protein
MRTLYHKTHHLMMLPEQQHGRMRAAKLRRNPVDVKNVGGILTLRTLLQFSHGKSFLQKSER